MALMSADLHLDNTDGVLFVAKDLGDLERWGDSRILKIKNNDRLQEITIYLTLKQLTQLHAVIGSYLETAEQVKLATA